MACDLPFCMCGLLNAWIHFRGTINYFCVCVRVWGRETVALPYLQHFHALVLPLLFLLSLFLTPSALFFLPPSLSALFARPAGVVEALLSQCVCVCLNACAVDWAGRFNWHPQRELYKLPNAQSLCLSLIFCCIHVQYRPPHTNTQWLSPHEDMFSN